MPLVSWTWSLRVAPIEEVVYPQQLHLQRSVRVVVVSAMGRVMIPDGLRSDLECHDDQKARIGRADT